MTDPSTPSASGASPRRWRWLLVASLALNLLFVGGVTALWLKGPPGHGRWGASQTAFGIMRFSGGLPPERREAVRKHLREARSNLKNVREDLRSARRRAAEVLASSDYTTEKMKVALDAVAENDNRMRALGTAALMSAIGELTPDDRLKLAEAWMKRLERETRRRGRRDSDETAEGGGPPR